MRNAKILMCLVPALALAACDDDGITGPRDVGPQAVVRVVNVVRDTGTIDFRFIDRVENLPSLLGLQFRSYSGLYQRTSVGTRPTRVFPTSTDPVLTQIMLKDTTINLTQNGRYTFVYAGQAGAGQDVLAVIEDPVLPDPGAGSIAVKALHGAHGVGAVDVYAVAVDSLTQPTPADWETNNAGVIANVGYLTQSGYATLPALASGFYQFVVTAAGDNTPLFTATPNLPGEAAPAGASYGPQPGVRIAGSVLTLVASSGTIPGTRESTAANQASSAFLMIDKTLDP